MHFQDLANKKLILVTGKGGVGKTTLSAAIALRLSRMGQKVLLAEIDAQNQLASLFRKTHIGYETVPLSKNLQAINIIPMKAFEEYVVMQIKLRQLFKAVFENKFIRFFIEGAPGLSELMSIGKIYSMVDDYDVIVVDAPATGHGMSLLQIPTIVAQAVRVGPLKEHSESIEALLKDSQKTCLAVVTLPEEMPVAETIELEKWTQEHFGRGLDLLLVNAIQSPLFDSKKDHDEVTRYLNQKKQDTIVAAVHASYHLRWTRAKLHAHYCDMLAGALPKITRFHIPYCFAESMGVSELQGIGDGMEPHP